MPVPRVKLTRECEEGGEIIRNDPVRWEPGHWEGASTGAGAAWGKQHVY